MSCGFRKDFIKNYLLEESPYQGYVLKGDQTKFLDMLGWNNDTAELIVSKGSDEMNNYSNAEFVEKMNSISGSVINLYRKDEGDNFYNDWWLDSELHYIAANFEYKNIQNILYIIFSWKMKRAFPGFARFIVKNYYLKRFSAVVSDITHSPTGKDFWKNLILECKANHKITILTGSIGDTNDITKGLQNGKITESEIDLNNIDQYWNPGTNNCRIKIYA